MLTEQEATAIYAVWGDHPHDKTNRIVPGENLWVRQLPGGLLGLDNWPVDREYRWQDIYTAAGKRVWRRWNTSIGFIYATTDDDEGTRKRIFDTLHADDVAVRFFWRGLGFAEFTSTDAAACRARLTAPELEGLIVEVEPAEDDDGEA